MGRSENLIRFEKRDVEYWVDLLASRDIEFERRNPSFFQYFKRAVQSLGKLPCWLFALKLFFAFSIIKAVISIWGCGVACVRQRAPRRIRGSSYPTSTHKPLKNALQHVLPAPMLGQ